MVLLGAQVGYLQPLVDMWGYSAFPEGSCLHAFAQEISSFLSTLAPISICIYPTHLQKLSQYYHPQEVFLLPVAVSLPSVPPQSTCVRLIITRTGSILA